MPLSPKAEVAEQTEETEASLKAYFTSSQLKPIEGIYESGAVTEQLPYYKLAIKKYGFIYKAIILESDVPVWKQGEVKAYLKTDSILPGAFPVKWYYKDKITQYTVCEYADGILKLSVSPAANSRIEVFKKIFPDSAKPLALQKAISDSHKTFVDSSRSKEKFNLGFESNLTINPLPYPWFEWGTRDYIMHTDSTQHHSGKYSIRIEPTENIKPMSFGCVAREFLAIYAGKEVEVKAYIKMDHINAPIGLLLRMDGQDPVNGSLEFYNMMDKGIKGTSDWILYSVKLPLPKETSDFYIGVINSGTGVLWVDDFQVLIDGVDIKDAKLK